MQIELTSSECQHLHFNGLFCDHNSGHKERGPVGFGMFHFPVSVQGVEYVSGGDTSCQGVSAVINKQVIDQLVQTTKYIVMITTEEFKLTKYTVATTSTGESLQCSPESWCCSGVQQCI